MAFPACGVDLCAWASCGAYSEYYGSENLKNLCNLFAFYGFLEDAPSLEIDFAPIVNFLRRMMDD